MTKYAITRLLTVFPVLLGVSFLVFLMLHLTPGDPVQIMLADSGASTAEIAQLRQQLGLNDPLPVQFGRFVWNAVRGDLGRSILSRRAVTEEISEQIPSTLELTLAGLAGAIPLGVVLGTLAAVRRNSWLDNVAMLFAMVGVSMPSFWLGLLLIFAFSLQLAWFPATGQGGLERLVLPAAALAYGAAAVIARLTRSSVLEVLGREYVTTARAKGLTERTVLWGHALKNALIPVITIVGLQFGALLAGTVVIETVFSRPGIGRLAITAILAKDFPLVQGIVLFTATAYVLINVVVDLAYATVDPRVRYG